MGTQRRDFLRGCACIAGAIVLGSACSDNNTEGAVPDDSAAPIDWDKLSKAVGGRLIVPTNPFQLCIDKPGSVVCDALLKSAKNPFQLQEWVGAVQTTGYYNAFGNPLSDRAVVAKSTADVVAAVNFAVANKLKLVIKGAGHDYLGRNRAPDSLLVWTHEWKGLELDDKFVPQGAPASTTYPAISVMPGERWLEVYGYASQSGRYVQGGGCTSVGACGGFLTGGGFGVFSRRFGTGAGGMLEVECVTADGKILVCNEFQNEDLFYALRGGGPATFAIVTRATLLTHPEPASCGLVFGEITGKDPNDVAGFKEMLSNWLEFYNEDLNNDEWGETFLLQPGNKALVAYFWLDVTQAEAEAVWAPFLDPLKAGGKYDVGVNFYEINPFARLYDGPWLEANIPNAAIPSDVPKVVPGQGLAGYYWNTLDSQEVSAFTNGFDSRYIPNEFFSDATKRAQLADALVEGTQKTGAAFVLLEQSKSLYNQNAEAHARDIKTSMNPAVFDAGMFAMSISRQKLTIPGVPRHEPDPVAGTAGQKATKDAIDPIRALTPNATYLNEASYFEQEWKEANWGLTTYAKLLVIKKKYDPNNFFKVHHGVGSDL